MTEPTLEDRAATLHETATSEMSSVIGRISRFISAARRPGGRARFHRGRHSGGSGEWRKGRASPARRRGRGHWVAAAQGRLGDGRGARRTTRSGLAGGSALGWLGRSTPASLQAREEVQGRGPAEPALCSSPKRAWNPVCPAWGRGRPKAEVEQPAPRGRSGGARTRSAEPRGALARGSGGLAPRKRGTLWAGAGRQRWPRAHGLTPQRLFTSL